MDLDRELDRAKSAAFTDSNAAFLGCLLCSLTFSWDKNIETACVSATEFKWNPDWFMKISPEQRKGVLLHELWHLALLHGDRQGSRTPNRWNIACDIRINNNLIKDGYQIPEGGCVDPKYMDPDITEEEIYNALPEEESCPIPSWGTQELAQGDETVNLVQSAHALSEIAGKSPGNVEKVLRQFLRPKLPWKQILHKYLLDKLEPEWSWNRPNRRYQDIYLPSFLPQDGRLVSIAMFLDTSGSISDAEIKRFTSEVKYIQEVLNPDKLTIIQFDTEIQEISVYSSNKRFSKLNIKGSGGTSYKEIHEYIMKHKPTVSIIFTDLFAKPMEPVGKQEVIWVVSNNPSDAKIGKTIHVE